VHTIKENGNTSNSSMKYCYLVLHKRKKTQEVLTLNTVLVLQIKIKETQNIYGNQNPNIRAGNREYKFIFKTLGGKRP
jgi:hypothetical protein